MDRLATRPIPLTPAQPTIPIHTASQHVGWF